MSRAVYDYLRTDELHPIVAAGGEVRATTDQLQAELLCRDCERMLNEGGEKWILDKFCTHDRKFPLFDLLHKQPAILTDPDGETFAAGTNPDIDVHKLCHFALGVFWKGALHPWKFGEIPLGPFAESIRTWLRGETSFPKNLALNVIVARPSEAQIIMNPPYRTGGTPCKTYLLHVPGILFRLSVGNRIPLAEKTLCLYSSGPKHFIVVSDSVMNKIFNANVKNFNESRKTRSYEKAKAKQGKLKKKP